jgi:hypothetical protein
MSTVIIAPKSIENLGGWCAVILMSRVFGETGLDSSVRGRTLRLISWINSFYEVPQMGSLMAKARGQVRNQSSKVHYLSPGDDPK